MKQYKAFKFKQFEIQHSHSAMKVGTDGVLLGSWAGRNEPRYVLDIGSGTGLIALMLAQRFGSAQIHAVEPDSGAITDAKYNFDNSPFCERLNLFNQKIQDFDAPVLYDLIVSNPPFFENALVPDTYARSTARHTTLLSFDDLIIATKKCLSPSGEFAIILPASEASKFIAKANADGLFVNMKTTVKGNANAPVKRVMLSFSQIEKQILNTEIIIEEKRHEYTDSYINLTKDFYLKM